VKSPDDPPEPGTSLAAHLRELRAEVEALDAGEGEPLTDTVAQLLTAHYAAAARKAVAEGDGALDFKMLRALTADVVALRKGDHSAVRLRHEQERLAIERERWDAERQEQIGAALDALAEQIEGKPEARAAFDALRRIVEPANGAHLSEEERARRIREIFGLPPEPRHGISPETLTEIERAAHLL